MPRPHSASIAVGARAGVPAAVPTDVVTARAGADGSYSATLSLAPGSWAVTAATGSGRATGYAGATVTTG